RKVQSTERAENRPSKSGGKSARGRERPAKGLHQGWLRRAENREPREDRRRHSEGNGSPLLPRGRQRRSSENRRAARERGRHREACRSETERQREGASIRGLVLEECKEAAVGMTAKGGPFSCT